MVFVPTKKLQENYWSICRSTLFEMRQKKELLEGVHYIYKKNCTNKRQIIYYNTELIEHGVVNGFKSESHINKCIDWRKKIG